MCFGQTGWQWSSPLPQGNDLLGVYAIDQYNALAVGKLATTLRTTDGGTSWQQVEITTNTDINLKSVFFVNSSVGWVVGRPGGIFYTSDGGSGWVARHSPVG